MQCARVDEKRQPIAGTEFVLRADLVFLAIGFAGSVRCGAAGGSRASRSTGAATSSPTTATTGPRATRSSSPATCAAASRWWSGRSAKAARRRAAIDKFLMGAERSAPLMSGGSQTSRSAASENRRPGRGARPARRRRAGRGWTDRLDRRVSFGGAVTSVPPGVTSWRVSGRTGPTSGFDGRATPVPRRPAAPAAPPRSDRCWPARPRARVGTAATAAAAVPPCLDDPLDLRVGEDARPCAIRPW